MNNCDDDSLIADHLLSDVQNILYDKDGYPQKRPPIMTTAQWNTGIVDSNGAPQYGQTLYPYKRSDGTSFFVVNAGQTVSVSTDMTAWTILYSKFTAGYKVNFSTVQNVLIMSNGIDDVMYWDGTTAQAVVAGAPALAIGDAQAGVGSNGVYTFKLTYNMLEGTATQRYSYGKPVSIGGKTGYQIKLSNIPTGRQGAVVNSDNSIISVWVSAPGDPTKFHLAGNVTAADNTFVMSLTDTQIGNAQVYVDANNPAPIDVPVPRMAKCEVYNNRLFGTLYGTSEVVWSDVNSWYNFRTESFLDVDSNDGEYFTGILHFKKTNQLIVFKKSGKGQVFPSSDTYDYKSLSMQGCTFEDSIQEFHVEDEHGSRDVVLSANDMGIWAFDGSRDTLISKQPDGNDIGGTWINVKQRDQEYIKHLITSQADWQQGDMTTGQINWGSIVNGTFTLENLFLWKSQLGISDTILCSYATSVSLGRTNVVPMLYLVVSNATDPKASLVSYTFDQTLKTYGNRQIVITDMGGFADTIKIDYDLATARFYGITSSGKIWRTTADKTAIDSQVKAITVSNLGATVTTANMVVKYTAYSDTASFTFIGNPHIDNYFSGGTMHSNYAYSKENYFFVPKAVPVKNLSMEFAIGRTVYYKNSDNVKIRKSGGIGQDADGSINYGQTVILPPGLYTLWSEMLGTPIVLQYDTPGNIDFCIHNGNLYVVSHEIYAANSNIGSGYINYGEKVMKRIDLSSWSTVYPVSGMESWSDVCFAKTKSIDATITSSDMYVSMTASDVGDPRPQGKIHYFIGDSLVSDGYKWAFTGTAYYLFYQFAVDSLGNIIGQEYHRDKGYAGLFKLTKDGVFSHYISGDTEFNIHTGNRNQGGTIFCNERTGKWYFCRDTFDWYEVGMSDTFDATKNVLESVTGMSAYDISCSLSSSLGSNNQVTTGVHGFKVTFECPAGKKYMYSDFGMNVKPYVLWAGSDTGKAVALTGIPQGTGPGEVIINGVAITNVNVWVSTANNTKDFYQLNGGVQSSSTATFAALDAAVTGWTKLTDSDYTLLGEFAFVNFSSGIPFNAGFPACIYAMPATDTKPYWRGVIGDYNVNSITGTPEPGYCYGEWMLTGANAIDATTDSWKLQSVDFMSVLNTGYPTEAQYNIATTIYSSDPASFFPVQSGENPLDGRSAGTNRLTLANPYRYVHLLILLNYSYGTQLTDSKSTSWNPPYVDGVVVNWIDTTNGLNIMGNVCSAVNKNFYYLAVAETTLSSMNPADTVTNNIILVLDRFRHWAIWRGDAIHPGSFTVLNDTLYWTDAKISTTGAQNGFIYRLGQRPEGNGAGFVDTVYDNDANTFTDEAIDAWYDTKNFPVLSHYRAHLRTPYDTAAMKKFIRRMYITALRNPQLTVGGVLQPVPSLDVMHVSNERKDASGNEDWTTHTIVVTDPTTGKTTKRVDYANELASIGYRHKFRFRNNIPNQDLTAVQITIKSFIFNER